MADYVFKPHERPTLPGSPANPEHPPSRMVRHFLIGITGGLGNALVTVNLNFTQGTLGLNSDEAAWLTAAYFMTTMRSSIESRCAMSTPQRRPGETTPQNANQRSRLLLAPSVGKIRTLKHG